MACVGTGAEFRLHHQVKFQGETDHDSATAFAAIPGAKVLHLHHNKHELTFVLNTQSS